MPELPEVETIRRGLTQHCAGHTIRAITIRQPSLRWPVPADLPALLHQQTITEIQRRGKYLLLPFPHGTLLIHLGMSGVVRVVDPSTPLKLHDHVEFDLGSQRIRYHDPRRFGCILWSTDVQQHPLLKTLGPEPLSADFNGDFWHTLTRRRNTPIKTLLMDSHAVVGIGNIYCNEALFATGIHPQTPSHQLSQQQCTELVTACKAILTTAIAAGGTTLKDFKSTDNQPGYFAQQLKVYGREGLPCYTCQTPLQEMRLAARTTVFCPSCQRQN